jgi:hypothetical protein
VEVAAALGKDTLVRQVAPEAEGQVLLALLEQVELPLWVKEMLAAQEMPAALHPAMVEAVAAVAQAQQVEPARHQLTAEQG